MSDFAKVVADNLFIVIGGTVAVVAIVASSIRSVIGSLSRERSRREIAAYIAEKSMTPEEGEKLLNAGPKHNQC